MIIPPIVLVLTALRIWVNNGGSPEFLVSQTCFIVLHKCWILWAQDQPAWARPLPSRGHGWCAHRTRVDTTRAEPCPPSTLEERCFPTHVQPPRSTVAGFILKNGTGHSDQKARVWGALTHPDVCTDALCGRRPAWNNPNNPGSADKQTPGVP